MRSFAGRKVPDRGRRRANTNMPVASSNSGQETPQNSNSNHMISNLRTRKEQSCPPTGRDSKSRGPNNAKPTSPTTGPQKRRMFTFRKATLRSLLFEKTEQEKERLLEEFLRVRAE